MREKSGSIARFVRVGKRNMMKRKRDTCTTTQRDKGYAILGDIRFDF